MFTPPLKNVNFRKFTPYVPGGVISVPKIHPASFFEKQRPFYTEPALMIWR